jgi:hypothetical protein
MNQSIHGLSFWSARGLGIAVALFLGLFALDALDEGAAAFLRHLAPMLLLLIVVAASWRRDVLGGLAFITLAVLYGASAWPRGQWILAVSGPLLLVGLLFLWNWRSEMSDQRGR